MVVCLYPADPRAPEIGIKQMDGGVIDTSIAMTQFALYMCVCLVLTVFFGQGDCDEKVKYAEP